MKHLEEIGETYWQHFTFAMRIAFVLFITVFVLIVHAVFPNVFKTAAYDVVVHLHAIMDARRNGEELPEDNENETGVA